MPDEHDRHRGNQQRHGGSSSRYRRNRHLVWPGVALAVGVILLVGHHDAQQPPASTVPGTGTLPATVVPGTVSGTSVAGGAPDVTIPAGAGAVDPAVTQANVATTICVSGYTKTVRPPTSATNPIKRAQMEALGISWWERKHYELDHVVPLEAGGAPADPANLKLESYDGPAGAHLKDKAENAVHRGICDGTLTLAAGQACFLADWHTCPGAA